MKPDNVESFSEKDLALNMNDPEEIKRLHKVFENEFIKMADKIDLMCKNGELE